MPRDTQTTSTEGEQVRYSRCSQVMQEGQRVAAEEETQDSQPEGENESGVGGSSHHRA